MHGFKKRELNSGKEGCLKMQPTEPYLI